MTFFSSTQQRLTKRQVAVDIMTGAEGLERVTLWSQTMPSDLLGQI